VLLLADEPTGALDTKTTQEVMDIFTEFNESGMTVVMVTHEPKWRVKLAALSGFAMGKLFITISTPKSFHTPYFSIRICKNSAIEIASRQTKSACADCEE
jgi:putative ABC transport system ATP-binding protein